MTDQPARLRLLVVTRSYPSDGNLYQYPFVHRRVLAYRAAGHEVAVFRPAADGATSVHQFDGVTCTTGDRGALVALVRDWRPDAVAAHGFSEAQWQVLQPLAGTLPICAWLHGSEIPEVARRKIAWDLRGEEQAAAEQALDQRCAFWNRFLAEMPARFRLVFVSGAAVAMARKDWGEAFSPAAVIPNPIDEQLFRYQPKPAGQRLNILMIRPFDSRGYGNDLAASAIAELARLRGFADLRITIAGDGPLFDDTLAPLRHFGNVRLVRRFLRQDEIAAYHREHGVFLVPTRIDTQGVSRDEAMCSGLVPVTNAVPAVTEFLDQDCGVIAPVEDAGALASGMWQMVQDPALFERRSAAAAERVRLQSGSERIIPRELALLEASARG